MFSDFVKIVNSQSKYNNGGTISAVPLVTFHNVRPVNNVPYTTNVGVFAELMKFLHDNGYKVLDMANLRYDTKGNTLHIVWHIPLSSFVSLDTNPNEDSIDYYSLQSNELAT